MEQLRRRKLNSVGSSGCDKKVVTPNIAVAFFKEERFKEWKKESGKWRIPVSRECLSGHSEGFSPKNPYQDLRMDTSVVSLPQYNEKTTFPRCDNRKGGIL